jgi:SET domain-containing protein
MGNGARSRPLSERVCKAESAIHGFGCFARVSFQAGDHIGMFEGPEVETDGTYVLWVYDHEGRVLSAREGINLLRWLNHSDNPNAQLERFRLFARCDIAPGEEITIDYGCPPAPDPTAAEPDPR